MIYLAELRLANGGAPGGGGDDDDDDDGGRDAPGVAVAVPGGMGCHRSGTGLGAHAIRAQHRQQLGPLCSRVH